MPPSPLSSHLQLENTLLQKVNGLPLPLLKICDFGYSKADHRSAARSKVRGRGLRGRWGAGAVKSRVAKYL